MLQMEASLDLWPQLTPSAKASMAELRRVTIAKESAIGSPMNFLVSPFLLINSYRLVTSPSA